MFIKICMNNSDLHFMKHCTDYKASTKEDDKSRITFYMDEDTDRQRNVVVNKSKSYVYIMNDSGDTIESYRWKYDEQQKRFTRM